MINPSRIIRIILNNMIIDSSFAVELAVFDGVFSFPSFCDGVVMLFTETPLCFCPVWVYSSITRSTFFEAKDLPSL